MSCGATGPGLGSTLRPEMADLVNCLRAAVRA